MMMFQPLHQLLVQLVVVHGGYKDLYQQKALIQPVRSCLSGEMFQIHDECFPYLFYLMLVAD